MMGLAVNNEELAYGAAVDRRADSLDARAMWWPL